MVRKHVGTEILASDSSTSGELESGPPLGIEQNFVFQPVRNVLLSHLPALLRREGPKFLCETGLAPCDVNRPTQGSNVRFIHRHVLYTRKIVTVNKKPGLTSNKGPCIVLDMQQRARKTPESVSKKTKKKRQAEIEVGPDGLTLAQRVLRLMSERGVGQTELARMCSQYYSAFVPTQDDKVKQQHIFNIIQGQASAWALPLIAAVFDVSDMWLQFGIGPKERGQRH